MSHRRITVQLTALLDLMLILVFMQYLEIDEHVADQQQRADQRIAVAEKEVGELRTEQELLAANLATKSIDLDNARLAINEQEANFEKLREQRDMLVGLLPDLFAQPEEKIKKLMQTTLPDGTRPTSQQIEQTRRDFQRLAQQQPDAAMRHLMTFNEMKKRCDLWHLHVLDSGVIALQTDRSVLKFRAQSINAFEEEFFQRYKSFADPKSLVIILFSYGDTDFTVYKAVKDGLPGATRRMEQDSLGRTRFTFREIGLLEQPPFEIP